MKGDREGARARRSVLRRLTQALVAVAAAGAVLALIPAFGAGGSAGPQRGESVRLKRLAGSVQFKPPGAGAFLPLQGAEIVPVRTLVDTRGGVVHVTSSRGSGGPNDTGRFRDGLFRVLQPDTRGAHTTAALRGRVSRSCDAGHRKRMLRVSAHRPFRTSGLHASAAALGTVWTMTDSCNGTLTNVRSGTGVAVSDFRTRERIVLHAGERYLAD